MASGCSSPADRALMELDVARGTRLVPSTGFRSNDNSCCSSGHRARLLHCLQQSIPYSMRYFQGLHHIASVILNTMEEDSHGIAPSSDEPSDMDATLFAEEKKMDDCIGPADDYLMLDFGDSPPLLVSDRAPSSLSASSSYCRPAASESSSASSAVPVSPPAIHRHVELTTSPAVESTVEMLHRLALSHLADSMSEDDLRPLQITMRLTIVPFVAYFDPELHDLLASCGLIDPTDPTGAGSYSFCFPWILTWFSYDPCLTSANVKRLFDAFVSAHPLLPVYTAVAILLQHRTRIAQEIHDGGDFCCIHELLSQLPRHISDWDAVLEEAIGLMRRLPPSHVVRLAEGYYGRDPVSDWIKYRDGIPQMLLCLEHHSSLRVPWFGNEIAKTAAGLGVGAAALRKARRRRKIACALLLLVGAVCLAVVSSSSWPCSSVIPTPVPSSTLEFLNDDEQGLSSAGDGLDASKGFPFDVVLDMETIKPDAWQATLHLRVIVTTFLALYLRNFFFASSGSVEGFDVHLLQQYPVDERPESFTLPFLSSNASCKL